jgi:polyisoprenoid-binding protein YceI
MSISTVEQVVPTGTWQLDPVHSSIGFEVQYMVGAFRGQFRDVEASLASGDTRIALTGAARVASVDVKDDALAAHLQSPEFFDAERHPELRFRSTQIERTSDEVAVSGEITIKGVTKPIELTGRIVDPITDAYGRERVGLEVSGLVDRTDFGLAWNLPLPSGEPALANDVRLNAELFFVKQEA